MSLGQKSDLREADPGKVPVEGASDSVPAPDAHEPRSPGADTANREAPANTEQSEEARSGFLVVGIGASAGGLEALGELIKHVPVDDMVFIVVQHLSPQHDSLLAQLLGRVSKITVQTAVDGALLEPNHVYVIPPNSNLAVMHGVIHLVPLQSGHGPRLPIDFLFRSIAEDLGTSAIGIVLSGTGTDGSLGLKAIQAAGGLTFVQEPSSAKYDGMPRSALATGAADFCLTPEQIGEELRRIAVEHRLSGPGRVVRPSYPQDLLGKIFLVIRAEFGTDLSNYKEATVARRIERRMKLHRLERLEDYVKLVQSSRDELRGLYGDMLITVTRFFRDEGVFAALRKEVFPQILKLKPPGGTVRVWVPGCATGEEAYSLAMGLLELCDEQTCDARIQIFGTDIDEESIQQARRGTYPANISPDVSPGRLNRFFVKKDNEFQVARRVRDLVVFSRQNVLKDAPFSRIDLVSCRNLLIYLQPAAQKKVLRTLHYALNPQGRLVLGTSETVGDAPELFSLVDRKNKIYLKKNVAAQPGPMATFDSAPREARQTPPVRTPLNLQGLVDRKILDLFGPPGVVVNEELEILQFRGHCGPYLDPAPGNASFNLLRIARFELHLEIKKAVARALDQQLRISTDVSYLAEGEQRALRLEVVPVEDPETKARCLLVLFVKTPPPTPLPVLGSADGKAEGPIEPLVSRIRELERELAMNKDFLQTTIEEKESTTEELKSANEELQSSNEELQSTNEELETSKEEIQSSNEELTTVNEELQNRMAELGQSNDDLHNVLAGVDNAIVIAGMNLRIRKFTSAAERLLRLVPEDVGRSVDFLDSFLGGQTLGQKVSSVIQSLSNLEEEVRALNGRWYILRISPYKTLDHSIRGALICLVDIDVRRKSSGAVRDVVDYAARFLAAIGHPLLIIDQGRRIVWANDPFYSLFEQTAEETLGSLFPSPGQPDSIKGHLREGLEEAFAGRRYQDPAAIINLGGHATALKIGANQIPASPENPMVLVSFELVSPPYADSSPGEP